MAKRYHFKQLELLRNQLLFAPLNVRKRFIYRLEKLLARLDVQKSYPYEYICHKITNYRPTDTPPMSLTGPRLQGDLLHMLNDLGSSIDMHVRNVGEPVSSVVDLMIHYGLSAKTLYRWRKKGLVGYTMVFPDGKRRLGFKQSALKEFEEKFSKYIHQSGGFRLMEDTEQTEGIRLARAELARGNRVFSNVVTAIASKLNRSRETIRHLLKRYESENPDSRIFTSLKSQLSERDKEHLFRLFLIGIPMKVLCQEYRRNRSTIYRIIYQIKAREIMDLDLNAVYNPAFDLPTAEKEILAGEDVSVPRGPRTPALRKELVEDLPAYLRDLHRQSKLLSREEEFTLFRRMNYLKHRAAVIRQRIKVAGPQAHIVALFEDVYQRMVECKQRLIRSNLRLVVSIAKRHTNSAMDFNTLISDGNLSLMQAVEKFDYFRGNRFSTYASWAIMKNYAKTIPAESSLLDTFRTASQEILDLVSDVDELEPAQQQTHEPSADPKRVLADVLRTLTEREREVIISRFGLRPKSGPATLEEIGSSFNLSKERIRQIETKALDKLRHELTPEQIEALLG